MNEKNWNILPESVDNKDYPYQFTTEKDSNWFEGHFPHNPILPGIAILKCALNAIKNTGKTAEIVALKRVKFKKLVKPGEKLQINVTNDKNANETKYELIADRKACSIGTVLFHEGGKKYQLLEENQTAKDLIAGFPLEEVKVNDIKKIVPHRKGMLLVGKIEKASQKGAIAKSFVSEKWPMVENGEVDSILFIEVAAQAIAALSGWKEVKKGLPPKAGFLVGIKNASIHKPYVPINTEVNLALRIKADIGQFLVVDAVIETKDEILIEVEIQVVRSEEAF